MSETNMIPTIVVDPFSGRSDLDDVPTTDAHLMHLRGHIRSSLEPAMHKLARLEQICRRRHACRPTEASRLALETVERALVSIASIHSAAGDLGRRLAPKCRGVGVWSRPHGEPIVADLDEVEDWHPCALRDVTVEAVERQHDALRRGEHSGEGASGIVRIGHLERDRNAPGNHPLPPEPAA